MTQANGHVLSEAGERYWHLWLTLRGIPESDQDGPLAEALRDRMDAPWRAMTPADRAAFRERVRGNNP
jgi:hypothetical protein